MGTIDDYLDELDPADRAVVEHVYDVVQATVPDLEQGKSYGMPALLYRGKALISVRVTNGAVRLTSWTLHLFSSDADVATIKAEPGLVITYRLTGDRDTPTVEPGSTHDELFAFFLQDTPSEPNNVLEPDEVRDLRFSYVAEGAGDAVFTAHLHGNVDVDSLFPRGNGADATGDVTVRRPPSTGN